MREVNFHQTLPLWALVVAGVSFPKATCQQYVLVVALLVVDVARCEDVMVPVAPGVERNEDVQTLFLFGMLFLYAGGV